MNNSFAYARPDSVEQAIVLHNEFSRPLYYSGGSEIITMHRAGAIAPDALIDLKHIPETHALMIEGDHLVIGSCVTLREIKDSNLFPLLGTICGRIADHTNQCRITLGGNLCATIIYRETAQAMLLADAEAAIAGLGGVRTAPFQDVFQSRMQLQPGEFLLRVRIPRAYLQLPFSHIKKTSSEKIDYPLISLSAIRSNEGVRFAFSGLYDHPMRSLALERAINNRNLDKNERLESALGSLPGPILADYQASSEYRRFVLKQTLAATMEVFDL